MAAKSMRAGQLRHRVRLLSHQDQPAEGGGVAPATATVALLWGELLAVSGGTYQGSVQIDAPFTHTLRLRWPPEGLAAVTTNHRVEHDGRHYRVRRVKDSDGRRRWLDIELEDLGVPDGAGGLEA